MPEPHILGVVDDGISKPYTYGNLIKHFIRILSALGVPDKAFLKLQTSFFEELHQLEKDKWIAIKHLYIIGRSDLAEKVISMRDDYCSNKEIREVLESIRRKVFDNRKVGGASDKLKRTKKSKAEGLNIRVELSRNVFGVCDNSNTLEEGTVFFQPTIRGKSVVIKGRVIVAKSPCYFPGDIRVLTCVDNKHCRHLVDCVVYPVKGKRPHCDEIAGSDLDGDKYFICWDPDLVPKQHWKPTSYQGGQSKTRSNIITDDLIRYFTNYDQSLVGRLSNLLEKRADIAGINSPECRALANLFNHAIDTAKTGENVTVPKSLTVESRKGKMMSVCQKMVNNAKCLSGNIKESVSKIEQEMREEYGEESEEYSTFVDAVSLVYSDITPLGDNSYDWILRRSRIGIIRLLMLRHDLEIREEATVLSNEIMEASEETIFSLLKNKNWPADDFKLFRMLYKWCQRHEKMNLLSKFCRLIDFSTFTRLQRELAMVDCPDSIEQIQERHSGLQFSSILSEEDVANLNTKISPTKWSLMYTMLNQDEEIFSWEDILSTMSDDLPKLLVCKFDLGGTWVITIFVPGTIELFQTSNDTTTLPDLRAFVSVHGINSQNCIVNKENVVHAVLLSRSRLQIYPADQSKSNTFICMMKEDGRTKMSVALQNFSSGFKGQYPSIRLRREPIISCEIFLGYSDIRQLPTYFVADTDPAELYPEIQPTECPEFLYRQEEFPVVSSSLEAHTEHYRTWFDEVDNKYNELKTLAANGTLPHSQLQMLFAMANGDSENGAYVASYVETLFSKTNTRLSDDYTDTPYYKLLCFLSMSRNSVVEKISRFLESMERKEIYFRIDTYINFLKLLVYGNAVDEYSVKLLKQFEIGLFPLDPRDFKTEGAKLYFLQWTSLLTIETMEEAKTFKKTAVKSNDITRADAFFESKMARLLNIQAERQMIFPQYGIALSPSHRQDKDPLFQPKYFAECVQQTGLVILVNLICKVGSDPEELTNDDVQNKSHWRVDRFITLVSFRRMLVALKSICACPSNNVMENCPIASLISPEFQDLKLNIDIEADDNAQLTRGTAATSVYDAQTSGLPKPSAKREGVSIVGSCERQEVNFPRPKSENRPGNKSQIEAIDAAMQDGVAIIQGPPGTGKTFTAAEIIRIWLENWESRPILACAETNEGVNNLIMKVLNLGCVSSDDMVRIGNVSKVTEEIKRITLEEKYLAKGNKLHDKQMDYLIVKDIIRRAKIVFSTCIGAGANYMTEQYFPHVLLDEASQATEPAAMVPLQYGCRRLCLVGDDKQLPPLVKSSNADQLEVSIFERLRQTFPTHLLNIQYRMHPTLAAFPSRQFYENRLLNGVEAKDRPLPGGFPHNNGKPVFFLDIKSRDKSAGKSKLNREEANEIKILVERLLEAKDVNETEIGIISPYTAQVRLLKEQLKNPKIDVRTVDGFQGQEREVIIISAVRSNDDKFVGFLDNQRRCNVLLTRARRGMIVVGNSETLMSSALWREWIDWTKRNETDLGQSTGP